MLAEAEIYDRIKKAKNEEKRILRMKEVADEDFDGSEMEEGPVNEKPMS